MRQKYRAAIFASALILPALIGSLMAQEPDTQSQPRPASGGTSAKLIVAQGRITEMASKIIIVKTPDSYPGGPGIHAQFIVAGPKYRADISKARFLLPDGMNPDNRPLNINDRVLIVMQGRTPGPQRPGSQEKSRQDYLALIVERITETDKVVAH